MPKDDGFRTALDGLMGGQAAAHAQETSARVERVAHHVISALCQRQAACQAGVRSHILDHLLRAITRKGSFSAPYLLSEFRDHRLTIDQIIDLYIPQAAIHLGDQWIRSELTFADVTIAALRLQTLLGEATCHTLHHRPGGAMVNMTALVVVPEDEQHFLGATVAAAQLRRLGVDVTMALAENTQSVADRALFDRPDMVLISCGSLETLDAAGAIVDAIKRNCDPAPLLALGGAIRGRKSGIQEQVGVDLVTGAVREVAGFCLKRKRALAQDI